MFGLRSKTETELGDDVVLSQAAKDLLNNDILKGAFKDVKEVFIREMLTSKITKDEREYFARMVNSIDAVEKILRKYVQNGQIAQSELNEIQNQAKRGY